MTTRFLVALLIAASLIAPTGLLRAQEKFPLHYLDSIGHLGNPDFDPRVSADLGIAKVFPEPGGLLRFQGRDAGGKLWRVWVAAAGGVGDTEVWSADFDHNGREDLLVSAVFPRSGRCVQEAKIYTLMFDQTGRPVPTVMSSSTFTEYGQPPAPILPGSRAGTAEIVTLLCEYADQPNAGFDVDIRLSGVFEARNARWVPKREAPAAPYLKSAQDHLGKQRQNYANWVVPDAKTWPDFLAGYNERPLTQLQSIATATAGCGGIRLGPIADGRITERKDDPCDLVGQDQVVLSDGSHRKDWPPVVIDSPAGRDVYLSKPIGTLMKVLKAGYRLRALGDDPESPSLLWVDAGSGLRPARTSSRVRVSMAATRMPVIVQRSLPNDQLQRTTFTTGGKCFVLWSGGESLARAAASDSCPAIEKLRRAGVVGTIQVRDNEVWQILPRRNILKTFRTMDGGELDTIRFQPAAGSTGSLVAAVEFHEGWLGEWRSGNRRWLVLHTQTGEPLSGRMALPVEGDLFDSGNSEGVRFLRWQRGEPAELITAPLAIEWSRTATRPPQ